MINSNPQPISSSDLANHYGSDFYYDQMAASLKSALKYADLLCPLYNPSSVVDVGCGRGTWLSAFKDKGASRLVGYDGSWNTQEDMIDQSIIFHGVDLNDPAAVANLDRFDLAISLEVAEHLEPSSANNFIRCLTNLSDVILFGAAYTQQGGTNHINEQPPSYWAKRFWQWNYVPYDLFRPVVWGDNEIPFWYQQNTFLYVEKSSFLVRELERSGHSPVKNVHFLDCVHPSLYEEKIKPVDTRDLISQLAGRFVPKALRPLARRLKSVIG